ncbi:MAG: glutamate-5-semialdehyde dehydrogenase [Flavobacteriaceae bacterium]|nr:glutamate-5-semialdehyde dehydrogenase [Flavobacteriaceae bacterium]MDZ4148092.1 glutamate-5-semialdehyde dehydrogenase [Flavobacteriaceae bacterium]
MILLNTTKKNKVITSMMDILNKRRIEIIEANKSDLDEFNLKDRAMYDRLIVNDKKIDEMIQALREVHNQEDPVGKIKSEITLENGLKITNKTAPFGTILIIYESRPDVTIEAAVLAFKANSKILLKGGKEAKFSNKILVDCWHEALKDNNLETDWIRLLELNREQTQAYLQNPLEKIDLIVPRGGEKLIAFVKQHATCAVLVSGRGNNFLYIDKEADWEQSKKVILNAKTQKISGCNALDKILINNNIPDFEPKVAELVNLLNAERVEVWVDANLHKIVPDEKIIKDENIWFEEFLAMKICIGEVDATKEAIEVINHYSGGHSAAIMTINQSTAQTFMEQVDCAAVYHNASTRFTDGGQMGVGAEMAISTDKLHHRGPLGLEQLVTNKYYVLGNGQIRN